MNKHTTAGRAILVTALVAGSALLPSDQVAQATSTAKVHKMQQIAAEVDRRTRFPRFEQPLKRMLLTRSWIAWGLHCVAKKDGKRDLSRQRLGAAMRLFNAHKVLEAVSHAVAAEALAQLTPAHQEVRTESLVPLGLQRLTNATTTDLIAFVKGFQLMLGLEILKPEARERHALQQTVAALITGRSTPTAHEIQLGDMPRYGDVLATLRPDSQESSRLREILHQSDPSRPPMPIPFVLMKNGQSELPHRPTPMPLGTTLIPRRADLVRFQNLGLALRTDEPLFNNGSPGWSLFGNVAVRERKPNAKAQQVQLRASIPPNEEIVARTPGSP